MVFYQSYKIIITIIGILLSLNVCSCLCADWWSCTKHKIINPYLHRHWSSATQAMLTIFTDSHCNSSFSHGDKYVYMMKEPYTIYSSNFLHDIVFYLFKNWYPVQFLSPKFIYICWGHLSNIPSTFLIYYLSQMYILILNFACMWVYSCDEAENYVENCMITHAQYQAEPCLHVLY